ncbi:MAG: glycosyltransferase, partial [Lacunisphaera sp.]
VVMYAGKLDKFKNGLLLAEAIKDEFQTQSGKRLVFLIIGNTEDLYGQKVEAVFAQSRNKIIRLPTQDYIDLAPLYQAADLAVFPAQCSLSFYDVQSCGIPVLLERIDLNEKRIRHANGFTFNPGDIGDLRAKIVHCADLPGDEFEKLRSNSHRHVLENFNFTPIAAKITEIMVDEVQRFRAVGRAV